MRNLAIFCSSLLVFSVGVQSSPARADEPSFLYLFVQDALPWHYAFRSDDVDGQRVTTAEAGLRHTTPFGLESLGGGAGIGYNGLNLQLDIGNALALTTLAVTGGFRGKISIDRLELWARAGIGPGLVFDQRTGELALTGAIRVQLEAGIDVFLVRNVLALGLKAVAIPQYDVPAGFFADFELNLGLRILI